jgi:allantoin racemase
MNRRIAIMGTGDDLLDQTDVPDPIGKVSHVGFEPVLAGIRGAVFPDSPKSRQITIEAYVEAGKRLAQKDFAALYINTLGDYGLQVLRDQLDIPVTGSGESAIRAAMSLGQSFSIVTIWPPKMQFIYDHILKDSGAENQCRSIYFLSEDIELDSMGQGDDFYSNMRACSITSLMKVRKAVIKACEKDGADTVILGCTCMSHLGPILKDEGFPVIEPMITGYRYTEFLSSI